MRVQFSTPKYGPMKQDGPERGYVPTISGFRWANENEDVYHSPVWPRMRIDTKPIVIMDRTT